MYGFMGLKAVVLLNCLSFAFSAVMEIFMHIPFTPVRYEGSPVKVFAGDIRESARYIAKEKPFILQISLIGASVNLFITPIYTIGVPFLVKITLGAGDGLYGLAECLISLGGILGAFLAGVFSARVRISRLFAFFVSLGAVFAVMAFTVYAPWLEGASPYPANYALFSASAFLGVCLMSAFNVIYIAFVQKQVPHAMMGKVMSLMIAFSMCCIPVGQLLFGTLFEALSDGVHIVILITAIITAAMGIAVHRVLRTRALPDPDAVERVTQEE